jgi:hypothetical protein
MEMRVSRFNMQIREMMARKQMFDEQISPPKINSGPLLNFKVLMLTLDHNYCPPLSSNHCDFDSKKKDACKPV